MGKMKTKQNIVREQLSAEENSEEDMCYDRAEEREWEAQIARSIALMKERERQQSLFAEIRDRYFDRFGDCRLHGVDGCCYCSCQLSKTAYHAY